MDQGLNPGHLQESLVPYQLSYLGLLKEEALLQAKTLIATSNINFRINLNFFWNLGPKNFKFIISLIRQPQCFFLYKLLLIFFWSSIDKFPSDIFILVGF